MGADPVDSLLEPLPRPAVQTRRGFVQNQDFGLKSQAARNENATLLSPGQLQERPLGQVRQAEFIQDVRGTFKLAGFGVASRDIRAEDP